MYVHVEEFLTKELLRASEQRKVQGIIGQILERLSHDCEMLRNL